MPALECFGIFLICFGYMLGMCWVCFGVSCVCVGMCWYVFDMFWVCVGSVLASAISARVCFGMFLRCH